MKTMMTMMAATQIFMIVIWMKVKRILILQVVYLPLSIEAMYAAQHNSKVVLQHYTDSGMNYTETCSILIVFLLHTVFYGLHARF